MTDRSRLTMLAAIALGAFAGAALPARAQPNQPPRGNRPPPGGGKPPAGGGGKQPSQPAHRPAPAPRPQPAPRPPVAQRPAPAHRPPPAPMHRPPPPGPYAVGRPLPREYLGYNYRIDRWEQYHLPRPRRGTFWIQYGADYVLVNPSGVVIQIWGR